VIQNETNKQGSYFQMLISRLEKTSLSMSKTVLNCHYLYNFNSLLNTRLKHLNTYEFCSKIASEVSKLQQIQLKILILINRLETKKKIHHTNLYNEYLFLRKRLSAPFFKSNQVYIESLGLKYVKTLTSPIDPEFEEYLKKKSLVSRVAGYQSRLMNECVQAKKKGWYILFATLTFRQEKDILDFIENPRVWDTLTKKISRDVSKKCYGSARYAENNGIKKHDYFRYFMTTEYGKLNGRFHIHALFFMKDIPYEIQDPNIGRSLPNYLNFHYLDKHWKFGHVADRAFLIDANDAWFQKMNLILPLKKNKENDRMEPTKLYGVKAGVSYLTKYVIKELESCQISKEHPKLIRMTKSLGQLDFQAEISKLPLKKQFQIWETSLKNMSWTQAHMKFFINKSVLLKILFRNFLQLSKHRKTSYILGLFLRSVQRALAQEKRPNIFHTIRNMFTLEKSITTHTGRLSKLPLPLCHQTMLSTEDFNMAPPKIIKDIYEKLYFLGETLGAGNVNFARS
jgi:hypothetical protein